jgi:hypothetical protein
MVINQGCIQAWGNTGVGLIDGGLLSSASSGQINGFYAAVYAGGVNASVISNSGSLHGCDFRVKAPIRKHLSPTPQGRVGG